MKKLIKITAIILLAAMLTQAVVYAVPATEPTITTGTNAGNSRARTRSEFIERHTDAVFPNLIHFRGSIYTAGRFVMV